jgi:ribosomal protein L39E
LDGEFNMAETQAQIAEEIIKGEVVKENNAEKRFTIMSILKKEIDIPTKTILKKEDKIIFQQLRRDYRTKEVVPRYETLRRIILEV